MDKPLESWERFPQWGRPAWKHQHEHCGVCGSCLLFAAQLHKCHINTLSGDIRRVFESDSTGKPVAEFEDLDIDGLTDPKAQHAP
jgi:hypothetical protein